MTTTWRYPLANDGIYTYVPKGATVLHVGMQGLTPRIWFLVNTEAPTEPRLFRVYGTGHSMPDRPGTHVGTFTDGKTKLTYHVFEEA